MVGVPKNLQGSAKFGFVIVGGILVIERKIPGVKYRYASIVVVGADGMVVFVA
jgi:hypothetical protein